VKLFGAPKRSQIGAKLTELSAERATLLKALRVDAARFAAVVINGEEIGHDYANKPRWWAFSGSIDCVAAYLAAGAPVDYVNKHGESMLHAAAEGWQPEVLQILLSSGAAVDAQNDLGRCAVHRWVEGPSEFVCNSFHWSSEVLLSRQAESLRILLDYSCRLDLLDAGGGAPLHVAVHERRFEAVRHLLLAGANIEQRTSKGASALLLAILAEDSNIARTLLESGADPHQTVPDGRSLCKVAIDIGSEEMRAVFAEQG
jgi:ankyrin repeat protein